MSVYHDYNIKPTDAFACTVYCKVTLGRICIIFMVAGNVVDRAISRSVGDWKNLKIKNLKCVFVFCF